MHISVLKTMPHELLNRDAISIEASVDQPKETNFVLPVGNKDLTDVLYMPSE